MHFIRRALAPPMRADKSADRAGPPYLRCQRILANSGHLAIDIFAEVFDDEFLAVWGVLAHVES